MGRTAQEALGGASLPSRCQMWLVLAWGERDMSAFDAVLLAAAVSPAAVAVRGLLPRATQGIGR